MVFVVDYNSVRHAHRVYYWYTLMWFYKFHQHTLINLDLLTMALILYCLKGNRAKKSQKKCITIWKYEGAIDKYFHANDDKN